MPQNSHIPTHIRRLAIHIMRNIKKKLKIDTKKITKEQKDTDEYKQRKKLYNQLYVEKQRAKIPQRPTGRPRKYILQTIELEPLETDISESSASDTSESTLSEILKQFPVLENDISLR